jgi:DHA1 family tetracycline resistance protein-like MFS transporter
VASLRGLAYGALGVVMFAMTLPMTRLAVGDVSAPQLPPAFVTAGRAAVAGALSVLYLLAVPVFAFTGFLMPGLQGLMTRSVAPHEQGQLQGANQSLTGIATIIGPFLFGGSFVYALKHESLSAWPGLPILIASALMVAAFFLAWRVGRPLPIAPVAGPAAVAGE